MINLVRTSMLFLAISSLAVLADGFGAAAQAQPYCQSIPSKGQREREPLCAQWSCMARTHCLLTPTKMTTDNRCVKWGCTTVQMLPEKPQVSVTVPFPSTTAR